MHWRGEFLNGVAVVWLGLIASGCATPATSAPSRALGPESAIGNGTMTTVAEFDRAGAPIRIGVSFIGGAFDNLPTAHSDGHRCFDADQNGTLDLATECSAWHEFVMPLPSDASRRDDVPFKWALVNWNSHGHIPPGVWDSPHFDVHFYIEPIEKIFALQRGTCGPEFVRCDQFQKAIQPVPANYLAPDYQDVQAVAPAMGNHLIDPTAPEFHGQPFTRHFIYGAYEGRIIFYEEMVSLSYLKSQPDACATLKMPAAVAIAGYYPRQACVRHRKDDNTYTVPMEDFVRREASPPAG